MLQTVIPDTHPTTTQLARLQLLDRLEPEALAALAAVTPLQHAPRGSVLLDLGETDDHLLYLLEGEIELQAADGGTRHIRHDEPSGQVPIARLRPSRYRVVAKTPVTYVTLPADAVAAGQPPETPPTIRSTKSSNRHLLAATKWKIS